MLEELQSKMESQTARLQETRTGEFSPGKSADYWNSRRRAAVDNAVGQSLKQIGALGQKKRDEMRSRGQEFTSEVEQSLKAINDMILSHKDNVSVNKRKVKNCNFPDLNSVVHQSLDKSDTAKSS